MFKPLGFPCASAGKESAPNAGDLDSIPGLGRSPGEGNSYPATMDCIVCGATKSQTLLLSHFKPLRLLGLLHLQHNIEPTLTDLGYFPSLIVRELKFLYFEIECWEGQRTNLLLLQIDFFLLSIHIFFGGSGITNG